MSDLPPGLEDFGERLTRAAERDVAQRRRQRRGRRLARNVALPLGAAVLAAGVSAGAVRVVDRGGGPIAPERGDRGSSLQAAIDSAVVMATASANPGGGPPWVLRAYTNADGRECVQVGRLRNGVFGQVQGGVFRALPASAAGSCEGPRASGPLVAARRASANLTIVYGLALDRSAVTVRVGDRARRVQPAGFGAFLALFEGAHSHERVVVTSKVAGRTNVRRLP